ncbi:MAG TPA: tubulin-like doman-containing protein [Gemmataceae bacterium]|nr:tubulin-like doman-containing protein [Gemmataceae bacterium]
MEPAVPSPAPPIAEPLPGYRLIERIGRGGFGEVWKAEAPGGILKAIKFVYGNLDDATEDGRPADQELKALNRVKSVRHPFILSLERYDIIQGQLVIVMELADRNLWDRYRECTERGLPGIPRDELLRYIDEAAEALDLMNSHYQIQHLDIKPQNLFLIHNHVKVADFGLAKDLEGVQATLTGGVTPVYAPPETFEGRVTRFCDQYSLAIVYQELLTGQRPFSGTTAKQLMMQHLQAEPNVAAAPANDQPVLQRALVKDAAKRFASCTEFVRALQQAKSAPAVPSPTPVKPLERAPLELPALVPGAQAHRITGQGLRNSPNATIPAATVGRLPALTRPTVPHALVVETPVVETPTVAAPTERAGSGVLFPALVVGLGQMGFIVLQKLRRAMRDNLRCDTLPNVRFFYIDTDTETMQQIASNSRALNSRETYQAKLNRPSYYQKPRGDQLSVDNWLNPQLLYRIPRNLTTTGVRAFGRLALWDHYRPIAKRLREELEACLAPTALAEAESNTGLGLRSNQPRVYIITALGGGTGSGMFLDLAYILRNQLKMLGYPEPAVHALLMLPHVDRNATKSQAAANAYAALQELLYYSSPQTVYEATFDGKEGSLVDAQPPFRRCLLLPLPASSDPRDSRPVVGTATGFLFRELFTPTGRAADDQRSTAGPPAAFQTFGSFRLTWPHEQLLAHATREISERVLEVWTTPESSHLAEPVRTWLEEQWNQQKLQPELLLATLRESCASVLRCTVDEAVAHIVEPLCEAPQQRNLEIVEACSALDALVQLVGQPTSANALARLGQLGSHLDGLAPALVSEYQKKLAQMAVAFMELPAYRLPGAEEALRQLVDRLRQALANLESLLAQFQKENAEIYTKLLTQINALDTLYRGSRKAAASREIVQQLDEFGHKRLECHLLKTMVTLYQGMVNCAPEYFQELHFCRQQLEKVRAQIGQISVRRERGHLGPGKPILPEGSPSLENLAERLLALLTADDLLDLDQRIQTEIRKRFKTLVSFCLEKSDHTKAMMNLLLGQAREFLEPRFRKAYSSMDIFQELMREHAAQREAAEAFDEAMPELLAGRLRAEDELRILAIPDDDAGRKFAQAAQQTLGDNGLQIVIGDKDIVFYREAQYVPPGDLPQLGPVAKEAFLHITHSDQAPPHSRSDIAWPTLP